ncbi:hypothetical protein COLO4_19629 [Corchorus olitorius]|uniref:Uncharacterized protein n=1 Tax=Corchorus olitorius TaxID=93759 RepID=A0A1R3J4E3_9ROSI|nr:hypothetical protein COLO4_19629 [Corchorus olitorius]
MGNINSSQNLIPPIGIAAPSRVRFEEPAAADPESLWIKLLFRLSLPFE